MWELLIPLGHAAGLDVGGRTQLLVVVIQKVRVDVLAEHVDVGLGKVPGADAALKQDVELGEAAA
jgi:hypothetical protein